MGHVRKFVKILLPDPELPAVCEASIGADISNRSEIYGDQICKSAELVLEFQIAVDTARKGLEIY